jgi:hypothetical protein
METMLPYLSKMMQRVLVVPWSMAAMYFFMGRVFKKANV